MIRRFSSAVLLLGCVWGGDALAQPVFDIQPTTDCLEAVGAEGDRAQCIGVAANDCMTNDSSTAGMSYCLEMEWTWWDDELNYAYQEAKSQAEAADNDLSPPLNVQAVGLRDMQRAWIAFRDARCNWEAALWQGGTGAGPAQLSCLMVETGRQAMALQNAALGD